MGRGGGELLKRSDNVFLSMGHMLGGGGRKCSRRSDDVSVSVGRGAGAFADLTTPSVSVLCVRQEEWGEGGGRIRRSENAYISIGHTSEGGGRAIGSLTFSRPSFGGGGRERERGGGERERDRERERERERELSLTNPTRSRLTSKRKTVYEITWIIKLNLSFGFST